jgi:hypothetical protein
MKSDLSVASVSDIHLGHMKTSTLHITTNLGRAFPDKESTHKLDIIFFGGDLFDRLLSLNQPDVPQILEWAGHFITMCEKHQIHLVFMEGTPSHDWGQTRLLDVLKRLGFGNKYFHYVTDLSVVHFDDLDIDVLFVPDEWKQLEPDDTWKEVRARLLEKNLEKVDFTILHGTFDFQLPEHVKAPRHTLERYQSITRHRIYGAHIHQASSRGILRVNGSFDRLAHGEEEHKGHWRTRFKDGVVVEEKFHINTHAKIYKTLDCIGLDIDKALDYLASQVSLVPDDSHIRVRAAKSDPIVTSFDVLRKRYPSIHWSSKVTEDEVAQKTLFVDQRAAFAQVQITPDNISELLREKLAYLTQDPVLLERCELRMKELI